VCLLMLLSEQGPSLKSLTYRLLGLPQLLGRAANIVQRAPLTLQLLTLQLLHLSALIQHVMLLWLVPCLLPMALLLLLLLSKQCLRMVAELLGPGPSPAHPQLLQDHICPVQQPLRVSKALLAH